MLSGAHILAGKPCFVHGRTPRSNYCNASHLALPQMEGIDPANVAGSGHGNIFASLLPRLLKSQQRRPEG